MEPADFKRLGDLFDDLVDAAPDQRASRLAALHHQEPELAARLERMLSVEDTGHLLLDQGAVAAITDTSTIGRLVGPYRLIELLGEGGMGSVFLAERVDGQFDRQVALKIQRQGLASVSGRRRFLSERQIVADLAHPNIARLLDGGLLDDGRPWFAMEYVQGQTLGAWLAGGPSFEDRLNLFLLICDAVHFAHTRLVVHRDLKPDNILIDADGHPKLVDFGIAKVLAADVDETQAGDRLMTPRWASPEQMRGGRITTATDVYALGMVLYQMVCGAHAHGQPDSLTDLEIMVCERVPPPPSAVLRTTASTGRRAVRGDLDTICMKALRKAPERRYPTAAALADDIRRFRRGLPVAAQPDTLWYRTRTFIRRHRLALGITTAVALSFAIMVGLFTAQLATERDRAQAEAAKARAAAMVMQDVFEGVDPAFARGTEVTAHTLLNRGLTLVDGIDEPALQADLLGVIGRSYLAIGKHAESIDALQRALTLQTGADAVATRLDLARALSLNSALEAAWSEAEQAATACQDWPARALWSRAQYELGSIALAQAKTERARTAFEAALAAHPQMDPEREAAIWDGLAQVASQTDDLKGAERHYRRALALYRQAVGDLHPRTAATLNDLAAILRYQNRLDDAERLYHESLALSRQLFKGDHPDVAVTLNQLGRLAFKRGEYAKAEPFLREAMRMRLAIYPPSHPMVSSSQVSLGANLWRQDRSDAAEPLFRAALAGVLESVGESHPFVPSIRKSLGVVLMAQQKFVEAEGLLRQSIQGTDAKHGKMHRKRAHPRVALGDLLVRQGRHAEAEPYLREAVAIRTHAHGIDNPQTAVARGVLGACLSGLGRADEARALLESALEHLEAALPATHPDVIATRKRLQAAQSPN
jgi:serine/threonine-protein kinase